TTPLTELLATETNEPAHTTTSEAISTATYTTESTITTTTLATATETIESPTTTTSTTTATATDITESTTTTITLPAASGTMESTTTITSTTTASDTITSSTTTTSSSTTTALFTTTTSITTTTVTTSTTTSSSSTTTSSSTTRTISTTSTSTTIPIVCNDITEVKYPNQRPAGQRDCPVPSIARPHTEIDGNYVLNPNDINGIVKNLTDIKDPINSTASLIVLRSFDGNGSNTNFGASFRHGVGGEIIANLDGSQISRMDMSIAGIATNIDSNNIKSLNILIIDDPFTYENFSTSSTKRLASSVVVMTAVQKSAFRSLVPMNIDLYFDDHSHEGSKIIETYKCSYYNTTALAWNEIGCSERNFNSNSKGYKCSFSHTATFDFLTFNCENTTHTIHNCNCGLKSDIQNETYHVIRSNSTNATIVANALSGYISSITNSNVSSNTSNTLSLNEIDEVIDKLINSTVEIDTTASYITVQPPKQQNISDDV
ncbi:unnamed protein product, partial [Adineta steineri]